MKSNEDKGGSGVSDEELARFMEQAVAGEGHAPKEPSARARMVTERLRIEEEQRGRAKGRKKGVRDQPEGWRTGPTAQELEARGAGKRRLKAALAIVVIAGIALIAVRPELVIDRITGRTEARREAGKGGPLPAESGRPTAPPKVVPPDRPTLQEPFRGSPALQWADGAAGIELPQATAVGRMSQEAVQSALARTRDLLVASNLDPAVLRGERPEAALKLLDPLQTGGHGLMERALAAPSTEADPLWLFSRFDPAEVRQLGTVVKTRGRMSFEAGKDGEVLVTADYTFVYPVVPAKGGSDEVARTVVRRTLTTALFDPKEREVTKGTLQVVAWAESAGNDDCSRDGTGYLHPQFPSELAAPGPSAPGPLTDPYDRSREIAELPQECGTVSRS
uniref:Uncharacterized protein n=1 Tax=Streptomyces sp. NBC_00049 TaxID=2903617 RepID=A0AAU2JUF4_9ACTN